MTTGIGDFVDALVRMRQSRAALAPSVMQPQPPSGGSHQLAPTFNPSHLNPVYAKELQKRQSQGQAVTAASQRHAPIDLYRIPIKSKYGGVIVWQDPGGATAWHCPKYDNNIFA